MSSFTLLKLDYTPPTILSYRTHHGNPYISNQEFWQKMLSSHYYMFHCDGKPYYAEAFGNHSLLMFSVYDANGNRVRRRRERAKLDGSDARVINEDGDIQLSGEPEDIVR